MHTTTKLQHSGFLSSQMLHHGKWLQNVLGKWPTAEKKKKKKRGGSAKELQYEKLEYHCTSSLKKSTSYFTSVRKPKAHKKCLEALCTETAATLLKIESILQSFPNDSSTIGNNRAVSSVASMPRKEETLENKTRRETAMSPGVQACNNKRQRSITETSDVKDENHYRGNK